MVFSRGRAAVWPVLLAIALYASGLGGGFIYDDEALLVDSSRLVTATPRLAFTSDFWGLQAGQWKSLHYRPAGVLIYSGIHFLFGLSPFAYHAVNILFHALAVLALFLLIEGLGLERRVAIAASLLFAAHPLHVESVAWITGLTETMAAAAVLGSLALFAHGRHVASAALGALAMLTKESGLITPVLIAAMVILRPEGGAILERLRRAAWAVIPYALLAVAYLAARGYFLPRTPRGVVTRAILGGIHDVPGVLALYLRKLFWPWPLAIHYELPGADGIFAGAAIAVLVILVAFKLRGGLLAAALLFLPLGIPAATSPLMVELLQAQDRYAYLASAGACFLAAALMARLPARGWSYGCLLLVSLAALGTHLQNPVWSDGESLWTHTLEVTPSSKPAALNLAYEMLVEKRFPEAARVYRRALVYHPADQELLKMSRLVEKYLKQPSPK